jgi:hypothetical protein
MLKQKALVLSLRHLTVRWLCQMKGQKDIAPLLFLLYNLTLIAVLGWIHYTLEPEVKAYVLTVY